MERKSTIIAVSVGFLGIAAPILSFPHWIGYFLLIASLVLALHASFLKDKAQSPLESFRTFLDRKTKEGQKLKKSLKKNPAVAYQEMKDWYISIGEGIGIAFGPDIKREFMTSTQWLSMLLDTQELSRLLLAIDRVCERLGKIKNDTVPANLQGNFGVHDFDHL